MKTRALINFAVPPEKKAQYKAACKILGISMTEVCIKALENSIVLAKTIQPGDWNKTGEPMKQIQIDHQKKLAEQKAKEKTPAVKKPKIYGNVTETAVEDVEDKGEDSGRKD